LTPEQIRDAAELEAVRYIYPAGPVPPAPGDPGEVAEVLAPGTPPSDFEPGDRAVPWNLQAVGADRAWGRLGVAGAGVTVAVLDVGVDY
ncbi:MAG: hypothetical protein GWN85_25960, partial [Gemmatimonadetes bacterium]|nr:hypothetical protein [Gemmatimonadota bacterium]NIS29162.1 hypothetical protein [Actinomycetota bacterium]NIU68455.1 hypothetical protein [Actinomycetota bacterium]NIW30282.1 hypothetical protein [Actinomycetota bacterium]NIX22700.1 hypothetical protein [Actinomycetota bacterium]